jgi:hypothetical protein
MKGSTGIIGAGLVVLLIYLFFTGCEQQTTKNYGGKMSVTLKEGEQLEMITWKGDSLWVLTSPRSTETPPKTHYFREKSARGVFQGQITIQEK